MRVPFHQVFQVNADGSVAPLVSVHVNGITMGPGVSFGTGVSFGGLDIAAIRGNDLEVDQQGTTVVIKGFYQ